MRRILLFLVLLILLFPVFAGSLDSADSVETVYGQFLYDDSASSNPNLGIVTENNRKYLSKEVTLTATLSEGIMGKLLDIGFSNTDAIGKYYEEVSGDALFSGDITLEDDDANGIATGPDSLYVFYKVLMQEPPFDIRVSIDNPLTLIKTDGTTDTTKVIQWSATLNKGNEAKMISSNGPKTALLYSHTEDSENHAMDVYKLTILAQYESTDKRGDIPAGTYTANLKIEVTKN